MKNFGIQIKKLIHGKYFSNFKSILKGTGLEVSDFRKYVSGDDYRYINRKLTAKHNELYIDIFHQEKDIQLDIFLDINYNWKGGFKKKHYKIIMEYLGDIFIYCKKNGLRIEIFHRKDNTITRHIFGKNVISAYQFMKTIPHLVKSTKRVYTSNLKGFLDRAKKLKKRRALIIFSDFLDLDKIDIKTLKYLNEEHAVYLFQIPINMREGENYSLLTTNSNLENIGVKTIQFIS